jgi:hypothetical protein
MRQCSNNMNLYLDNPPSICYNIAQQFFFEAIMKTSKLYLRGMRDGIPIALGYLSVSFGFGVSAVSGGLSPLEAVLMSLTNVTSAG